MFLKRNSKLKEPRNLIGISPKEPMPKGNKEKGKIWQTPSPTRNTSKCIPNLTLTAHSQSYSVEIRLKSFIATNKQQGWNDRSHNTSCRPSFLSDNQHYCLSVWLEQFFYLQYILACYFYLTQVAHKYVQYRIVRYIDFYLALAVLLKN